VTHQSDWKFHKKNNGVFGFEVALFFHELFASFSLQITAEFNAKKPGRPPNSPAEVRKLLAKYRDTDSVLEFTKFGRMKSVTCDETSVTSLATEFMYLNFGKSNTAYLIACNMLSLFLLCFFFV
jgi:hypothetical protein